MLPSQYSSVDEVEKMNTNAIVKRDDMIMMVIRNVKYVSSGWKSLEIWIESGERYKYSQESGELKKGNMTMVRGNLNFSLNSGV